MCMFVHACLCVTLIVCIDCRPSSIALSQAAQDGVKVLGGQVVDYGRYCLPQSIADNLRNFSLC